ncbi:peptidoglycan hydrolase-like protein with peptidoglycan-binding domain [Bacillus mesophilus]|uniref:N-acetylmuramoyl-L-alanine amidase n=2 Tax=Bacillus mesophilus TaxID=1808955 RepID=A0A6M0Q9E6_9BACI|nr:peptidoglycan hydrolase-like protein with peptidoglycan-binding domain [Bacillus mesophilus]NEY73006.1 N-acetylmuramoyl-L-alanine amidase [Bacillus mesophilus]
MRYNITRDYIDRGNSRPGTSNNSIQFIVSHDTGNAGSTAYANRNYFDSVQPSASAHTFIDDNYILEIIPLDEIAYHVRYNVSTDDRLYGADANDAAIGVELCWGGSINFDEAYKRYVWYHAYLLDRFGLDPDEDIVAHSTLDPTRRRDPQNALQRYGISWNQFLADVKQSYQNIFVDGQEMADDTPSVRGVSVELPLGIGDEGQFVREVQQELIQAGFPLPRFGADGVYGEETETAVMRFQRRYGLVVDGLVGPNTLRKLNDVLGSSNPSNEFPLANGILRSGDEGTGVRQLQRVLKQVNFDPGAIDGIYGPKTADAVRRFQSMYAALATDSIYGPNTRRYLRMELADQS